MDANIAATETLLTGGSHIDAIETGCSVCEVEQCDGSVGYGGSPDELGNTTLDAMIMNGETHDVGSVGCLKDIRSAISVARKVMETTKHTLLVGDDATNFAIQMGFTRQSSETNHSLDLWAQWKSANCQPNYRVPGTVIPNPSVSCGPYSPVPSIASTVPRSGSRPTLNRYNHDTIGMIVVDAKGQIGCGTTTNGASHKIPGRVGDSPIVGAGCYVQKGVGGAAATGDGDIMMRFLPTYQVVQSMAAGMSPGDAATDALVRIVKGCNCTFQGALVAASVDGTWGAATNGFNFSYTVYNPSLGTSTVIYVNNNMEHTDRENKDI